MYMYMKKVYVSLCMNAYAQYLVKLKVKAKKKIIN